MHASIPVILLVASSLPSAMAGKCSAVGWISNNHIWGGPDGSPSAATSGVRLYDPDGNDIGDYDGDDPSCSDLLTWRSAYLDDTFSWGATCNMNGFTECHGAYATQTHIDGEGPSNGNDYYGLGIESTSECKVLFDC